MLLDPSEAWGRDNSAETQQAIGLATPKGVTVRFILTPMSSRSNFVVWSPPERGKGRNGGTNSTTSWTHNFQEAKGQLSRLKIHN